MQVQRKRIAALLMAGAMLFSTLPVNALAVENPDTGGLCEHHPEHTTECGYTEGVEGTPCDHEHTEDCYALMTECVHEHGPECYPQESVSGNVATPPDAEQAGPVCAHECSEESGCIVKELDCQHEHDSECGYTEAVPGTPCTFVCEECNAETDEPEQPQQITITEFDDLAKDVANQIVSAEKKLNLPDTLGASGYVGTQDSGGAEHLTIEGVTWEPDRPYDENAQQGAWLFTAVLPEKGYTLLDGVELPEISVLTGPVNLLANKDFYDINKGSVTIDNSCGNSCSGHTISGTTTTNTITVTGGTHNITIENVDITPNGTALDADNCAFSIENGATVKLTLLGSNILTSAQSRAGLQVPKGAKLHITKESTGNLYAGGHHSKAAAWWGAGIGGGKDQSCGTIIIEGGTITAVGGYDITDSHITYSASAGIGGGMNGGGGEISITGAMVIASGYGDAIGPGWNGSSGTVKINNSLITIDEDTTVYGNFTLTTDFESKSGTFTIPQYSILTVLDGVTLTNNGSLENNGTISGAGIIQNNKTLNNNNKITGMEKIQNDGTINNNGTISNIENIQNREIINNDKTITDVVNFQNFGTIDNTGNISDTKTISSSGTINNNGTISGTETISSGGTINNNDTISGTGKIQNDGTIENIKTISSTENFQNNNIINNANTGTITDVEKFQNDKTINNNGTISDVNNFQNNDLITNNQTMSDITYTQNNGIINNLRDISGKGTIYNVGSIYDTGTIADSIIILPDDNPPIPFPQGTDVINKKPVTIDNTCGNNCPGHIITGEVIPVETPNTIQVTGGTHDITIQNVDISAAECAFSISGGATVNLTLVGMNTLKSGNAKAGLNVSSNSTLVITQDGTGSLEATGGSSGKATSSIGGAGIGGNANEQNGKITINGGVIVARGGKVAAGIGSGTNANGGEITINGGTIACAAGNTAPTAIGNGGNMKGATPTGSTVIITGGSVATESINNPPQNAEGTRVYWSVTPEIPNVTDISVDGVPYYVPANHKGDNRLYLYMTGTDHTVTVRNSSGEVTTYEAKYSQTELQDGGHFTFKETSSGKPSGTSTVQFVPSSYTAIEGQSAEVKVNISTTTRTLTMDTVKITVTPKDPTAPKTDFSYPATVGTHAYTLDVSALPVGEYTLVAEYGGGATAKAATSQPATLRICYDISKATVKLSPDSFFYDGSAHTPTITKVTLDGKDLRVGTDYSVGDYEDNTDVGTATVAIKGIGSYASEKIVEFEIKQSASAFSVGPTVSQNGVFTYGETITITGTVKATGTSPTSRANSTNIVELLNENNKQIAWANVDSDGKFTLEYATGEQGILIGAGQSFTVKYSGNDNQATVKESVTITLNPKQVEAIVEGAIKKSYDGNKSATVTLKVNESDLVNQGDKGDKITVEGTGTYASVEVGNHDVDIMITKWDGDDKDWYTVEAPKGVTGEIVKRGAAAAPKAGVDVTANSVTLEENAAWEYSADQVTWGDKSHFEPLNDATKYTYYVRIKETDTDEASQVQTITVYTAPEAPDTGVGYSVNYRDETLTVDPDYEVNPDRDFNGTTTAAGGTAGIEPGKTYYIRVPASKGEDGLNVPESETVDITLKRRPAAPTDLQGVNETKKDEKNGQIINLRPNTAYELSSDGGASWKPVQANAGGAISGLAVGSYQIRFPATENDFYSLKADVEIGTNTYTLNVAAPTFDAVFSGYAQPEAKALTISSSGNARATISSVTVDSPNFEIGGSGDTVTAGGSIDTWTVRPAAGLGAGEYKATITVAYDHGATAVAEVHFTVKSRSSGGGSSSGGNSTVTDRPDENDPDSPTTGQTEPVKPDKGGNVTIGGGDVQDAINKATADANKNGNQKSGIAVTVPVNNTADLEGLTITIPAATLDKLVTAKVRRFDITTNGLPWFSFTLNTLKMLDTQSQGGDLILRLTKTAVTSAEARAAIGTRPAYDITLVWVKGGKETPITDWQGQTISVKLPYTPVTGEQAGNLYAVSVDASGKVEWLTKSSYDADQKAVLFEASHFSVYGVGYKLPAPVFTDISGHWAEEHILFVASRGLLNGTGNGQFSPNTGMTRGMFVTALGRLAGIDPASYQSGRFADVAANAYYAPYVNWAAQAGIVNGTTETTFSPDSRITREQMAVMMKNYADKLGYDLPATLEAVTFADDANISAWAKSAVKAMQRAGILAGKDGNRFDPKGTATRAEVATVLHRFVEIVIDPQAANGWTENASGTRSYYKGGKPAIGWLCDDKWYWLESGGVPFAGGWKQIGGKWYFFNPDGTMTVNTTIDGYTLGPDGARK